MESPGIDPQAVAASGNILAESALITEAARRQLLMEWNATHAAYSMECCVPQLVTAQAAATPDATALVTADHILTYRDLDTRSNQLAHHLRTLGVGPDVLVGLCMERSVALVVGALSILKAGGAYVPLDPAYPADRLAFMLHDAHVAALVTQQSMAAHLPTGPWPIITLRPELGVEIGQPEWGSDDAPPLPLASAETLAYVIYTSGSTGQPKGVQITHASLLNLVFWHQHAFEVTAADRATQLAGPGFDAVVWELWPYLTAGASVALPDEETRIAPALLRGWLLAQGITITFAPTALAEGLMALEWPLRTTLRLLLTGAETLHRFPSPELPFAVVNNYGPTEATVVTTSGRVLPTAHPDGLPSLGRPIANVQVYILDAQLHPVAIGMPGELHIGGAGVARGYLNRPDLTAEKFILNPFSSVPGARLYKTGDLACYRPDGSIEFLGRDDQQVKIRGFRIELGEIEATLGAQPDVQTSLVVAREDMPGEKRLVAYVVPAPGSHLTAAALQDVLSTRLPDYMAPSAFVWLEALPLTPNGKLDRAALPVPDAVNTARYETFVAPHTVIEERLAEIVATLLGLEQVGVDDNFFLLGGHSLLGTQVIARVAASFGVDLSLRSLFEGPTVAQLSAEIERLILATLEAMSDDAARARLA